MIKKLRIRLTVIFTSITGLILLAVLGISAWYAVSASEFTFLRDFSQKTSYVAMSVATESLDDTEWLTEAEEKNQMVIFIEKDGAPIEFTPGWEEESRLSLIEQAKDTLDADAVGGVGIYTSIASAFSGSIFEYSSVAEPALEIGVNYAYRDKDTSDVFDVEGLDETEMLYDVVVIKAIPALIGAQDTYSASYTYPTVTVNMQDAYLSFIGEDTNKEYRLDSMMFKQQDTEYGLLILGDKTEEKRARLLIILGYSLLFLFGTGLLTVVSWFLSKLIVKPTEESIKRQNEFVAAASHELRNPLAVIKTSLSAASIAETNDESRRYYAIAGAEADRMSRLIGDLALLSGSDSKKWTLSKAPLDVDTVLIELSEEFTPLSREKGKNLILSLPEDALGEINGDVLRIRQIISIFIDNALAHGGDGDTITLSGRLEGDEILISVSDQGVGVPDELKEKIFERFFCADDSRTSKEHFGLGLSIAQEFARLHGGKVTVSDTEGGGATFTLTLCRS